MDSLFRFKKFSVSNCKSALKVGTDAILLGSLIDIEENITTALDIGTGTGVIALMVAQKLNSNYGTEIATSPSAPRNDDSSVIARNASSLITRSASDEVIPNQKRKLQIQAIDIDKDSCDEAAENFKNSPWSSNLNVENISLQNYHPSHTFDLIISNPPYFENSLKNPNQRESIARHCDSLSIRDICAFCKECLQGKLWLILPYDQLVNTQRIAASFGLKLYKQITIYSSERKAPKRVVLAFSKQQRPLIQEKLIINRNGSYSEEYRNLTKDFLFI